jgi:HEAT repeat protein
MCTGRDGMRRECQLVVLGLLGFASFLCPRAMPQAKPPAKAGKAAPSKLADIAPPVRDEIDRLMSGEAGKRASGAASLAEMGDAALPAIPYLIDALSDDRLVHGPVSTAANELSVRSVALYTLWKLGRPAVDAIIASLKSESWETRGGAAWALAKLKIPEGVQPLVDLLSRETEKVADKRPNVLGLALYAIEEAGDKRAVPALISLVNLPAANRHFEAFQSIVPYACRILGKLKDPRAIEPLISLAERAGDLTEWADQNHRQGDHVREAALTELGKLTGQEGFFKDPKTARTWWEQNKSRFQ